MSSNLNFSLAEATAELRRQQERLQGVRSRLRDVKSKVTSKDGMITVTLDGRGDVSSIAFNTTKFRRMAPAELGAALVEVIGRARAQGREQVADAYREFLPPGLNMEEMLAGKADFGRMFDDAVQKANDIMARGPAGDLRRAADQRGGNNG
ncbi:MAG TPA: YbaB/EbfC family nucleoid-associated protein [Streptosporangiaceae bacterium]